MKTLTLKLPDALDRKLTVSVSQRGMNKSVLIQEAIEGQVSAFVEHFFDVDMTKSQRSLNSQD